MARRVKVELIGNASSLNKAFKSAGHNADKFGKKSHHVRKVAGAALLGIGAAGVAGGFLLAKGLKSSIAAAMESQKVMAQTRAVLQSTGGAAKVTAKHVGDLATKISQYSGIDDEAVQATENMLLTFTKVRNETGKGNKIFDQATKIVTDMSVALGQDSTKSAIQLGKALNDPIKGVGSLRRVGVAFTEQQVKQMKTLVEHGHLLKAQKIILHELGNEFGGSAYKRGKTFTGQMDKLKVNVENLQERIGNLLLPVLTKWANKINAWLSQAKNQRKVIHDIRVAVRIMVGAIRVAAKVIGAIVTIIKGYIGWGRRFVAWTKRMGDSFRDTWNNAKRHTMSFYNWIQRTGIKIALAIIEPFSHLPGMLGGKKFQRMKEDLQGQLQALTPGKAAPPARHDRHGNVRTPVRGAIRAAGGRLRVPDDNRAPHRGSHETHVHNIVLEIDGKPIRTNVKKHDVRSKRRTTAQRGGRHPGTVLD